MFPCPGAAILDVGSYLIDGCLSLCGGGDGESADGYLHDTAINRLCVVCQHAEEVICGVCAQFVYGVVVLVGEEVVTAGVLEEVSVIEGAVTKKK